MYFTDGVVACLVAESFEWTDEPVKSSTRSPAEDLITPLLITSKFITLFTSSFIIIRAFPLFDRTERIISRFADSVFLL